MTAGAHRGGPIVVASWAATVVFIVSAVGAVLTAPLRGLATGVSLLLFAIGSAVFLVALGLAAGRSRTRAIGIGGLFFLAGDTAPAPVRRRLMAALAVQTAVALTTAAARPFTSQAFCILAPLFGLAMSGLWGARHGSFGLRPAGDR